MQTKDRGHRESPSEAAETSRSPLRYLPAVCGFAVFASAQALYAWTVAPSVMPGDYAEFQMCAAIMGIPHPTGYPLYILLGKLFTLLPVGDVAYRVNLSSAFYMAGAAGMLCAIALHLVGLMGARSWWWAAGVGAVFFALAPTVWSMALVARSYALNALLVSSVVFALVNWRHSKRPGWFFAACLLIGLSMVHHGTTYLLLPAYGLYLLLIERERRKRGDDPRPIARRLRGVGAFLLGYSPILFLVYRFVWGAPYYWGNPTTWKDFFNLLGGGPFQNQVLAFGWGAQLDRVAFGVGELSGQYTPLGIALGLAGLWALWRSLRAEAFLITLMMAANFFFAMNYSLVGYLYFIPTYLIWGLLMAVGIAWAGTRFARLVGRPAPVGVASGAVILAGLFLAGDALYTRYDNISLRHQTATRDTTLALLNEAPQGANLYMDWEDVSVVRFYRLVYGMRPDLAVHTGDPADWAGWIYCDVTNGVPAYVGKFAGALPPNIARDFSTQPAPLSWRVTGVTSAAKYEVPPCGTCATCR